MDRYEPTIPAGGGLPSRSPFHDNPSQSGASEEASGSGNDSGSSGAVAPGHMAADGVPRRSLAGRFQVNAQTGGVSCTMPIDTSPGRSGFGPELNLGYNSGSAGANGVFGLGWSLSGVDYITRKTSGAVPKYEDQGPNAEDTFVHSQLGDLVALDEQAVILAGYQVRSYRPRFEAEPILIQRWLRAYECFWKTISSDNTAIVYGRESSDQVFDQGCQDEPKRIFTWLASEAFDSRGNHMKYTYKAENNQGMQQKHEIFEAHRNHPSPQRYLKSIQYGNVTPCRDPTDWDHVSLPSQWLFEVVIDYGEHDMEVPTTHEKHSWDLRPDPFSTYNSGFEIRTYRRCRRILMFHHFAAELGREDYLVSSTSFAYGTDTPSGATLLQSYTHHGHSLMETGGYCTVSDAPSTFVYTAVPRMDDLPVETLDLTMSGITTADAQWIDLDGEGAPGILTKGTGGAWYYQRNLTRPGGDPEFGDPRAVASVPNVSSGSAQWSFEDLRLNGLPTVVLSSGKDGLCGYYEREEDGDWLNFVPFETYPVGVDSASTVRVDLNGDGHADLLDLASASSSELTWHPSRGLRGFGPAQWTQGGPVLPFQDPRCSVRVCDMTGDGLADIVQIGNGSITYWPNLGHGKFGSQVTMGHAPRLAAEDAFSPQCIRTHDLTGSGTTDLVYVHPEGGATIYYNCSGNTWSQGYSVRSFPALHHASAVDLLDLRGLGTPCLCWTSDLQPNSSNGLSTVRFIDLMARQRPCLLARWSNGAGRETSFAYKSTFSFAREDELQGNPWSTSLPFPVQCVERAVTLDRISQLSHTTRYAFHNGVYDHEERQFRGFQLVDTWDAEQLQSASSALQRPPVLTRTWFHSGLRRLDEASRLPQSFAVEGGPRHADLSGPIITSTVPERETADEVYRALAGRERRTEVYSVDASDARSALPYTITQKRYEAVVSRGNSIQVTTTINDCEEVTAQYERVAQPGSAPLRLASAEAKIQQRLVLETDDYGNIILEAAIQYGKEASNLSQQEDRALQEETIVTFTDTSYTKAHKTHDYFQVPLPALVQQYRLFPAKSALPGEGRYCWETFAEKGALLLRGAAEMPVEDGSERHSPVHVDHNGSRVLLSKKLTLYTSSDLKRPLDIQGSEPFSILHQTYQLACTSTLLERALERARPATLSAESCAATLRQAGYVEFPIGSGSWWTASNRQIFGHDRPDERLAIARRQFYIADGEVDPFGSSSSKKLDPYSLLTSSLINAVGSRTSVWNDYVGLKPLMVTDANMNRLHSCYDPLRRPLGVAMLGKEARPLGNNLDGLLDTIDASYVEAFLRDPVAHAASMLRGASQRTIYALDQYSQSSSQAGSSEELPEPNCIVQLVRHRHVGEEAERISTTNISIEFRYLDGNGDIIQVARLSRCSSTRPPSQVWDFSGWVINDNKGQPVQKFQPFQAADHKFRRDMGERSLLAETVLRDPLDRIVGSIKADHSWSKARFTPWMQVTFDQGSTIMIDDPAQDVDVGHHFRHLERSLYLPTWYAQSTRDGSRGGTAGRLAALQSKTYASSSSTVHLDALGRPIMGEKGVDTDLQTSRTRHSYRGEVVEMRDTLGRVVDTVVYDLLGRALYKKNIDSGERWSLPDSQGQPFMAWSSRDFRKRVTYDALRRTEGVFLLSGPEANPSSEVQIVKKVYGESAAGAVEHNLTGQLYQCYDQAGLNTNSSFDIMGGCTRSTLRFAVDYRGTLDWSALDNLPALEDKIHTSSAVYNALGQTLKSTQDDLGCIMREYDAAGRLQRLSSSGVTDDSTLTSSMSSIDYNAEGMVARTVALNGVETRYTYDPQTRRLLSTHARRIKDNTTLHEISHVYDVLGRIVQTSRCADINPVRNEPVQQRFEYNHFGQLVSATGRMQTDPNSKQLRPYDFNTNNTNIKPGGRLVQYKEAYTYDEAGNIKTMQIVPEQGYSGWTRTYTYERTSNRLIQTQVGSDIRKYQYDGEAGRNGCMTSISGYSILAWDQDEQLRAFSTQYVSADKTPETTWYVYTADGARARKVTERSGQASAPTPPPRIKETRMLALGDILYRYQGGNNDNNNSQTASVTVATLDVSDSALGRGPVAVIESGSHLDKCLARYRVGEQLELDGNANMVWYQELSPFGSLTFQTSKGDAPRVYRFASYRWDCESGLYSCGARYYASWIGRWISADPLGTVDGLNLYVYVGNDPVNFDDPGGTMRSGILKAFRSVTSMWGAASNATVPRHNSFANSGSMFNNMARCSYPEATGAPQQGGNKNGFSSQTGSLQSTLGHGGGDLSDTRSSRLISILRPSPEDSPGQYDSLADRGKISIYRVSDMGRALAFQRGDVNALVTRSVGDFNHEAFTTGYFSSSEYGAMLHTQWMDGPVSIMRVDILVEDLLDAHIYNSIPDEVWRQRVAADRLGLDDNALYNMFSPSAADAILEGRSHDISIGPESTINTDKFQTAQGKLTIGDMRPQMTRDGRYGIQLTFKGQALRNLYNYDIMVVHNVNKIVLGEPYKSVF